MSRSRAKFCSLASTTLISAAALLVACSTGGEQEVGSVSQRVVAPGDVSASATPAAIASGGAQAAIQDRYIVVFKPGTIGKAKGRAVNGSGSALRDSLRSQFGHAPGRVYSKVVEGMAV